MIKDQTYVPLYYDFMFKGVFANEKELRPITALLSSFLEIPYEKLKGRITLLNNEMSKENIHVPGKRLDVLIRLEDGEIINVEMNSSFSMKERNVSYLCEVYSREQRSSKTGYNIPRCIQINFNRFKEDTRPIEIYELKNDLGESLVKNFQIYEVNIEKCSEIGYTEDDKVKWGSIMKLERIDYLREDLETMDIPEDVKKVIIKRIDELNAGDRLSYLRDPEWEAEQFMNAEREIAAEQGHEQGITQEKISIAKKLKEKGNSFEDIMEITGLSEEELHSIFE